MSMLIRFDWRPASTTKLRTSVKFSVWLTIVATFQLMGDQAMPQSDCDVARIARTYVESNFPFITLGSNRRVVTSQVGPHWQVRFSFDPPATYLGMVPEITVDPRTCQVVAAKVWQ